MAYEKLFSSGKIGNLELKNRVVMAPMLMDFGQFDGTPTEQMMDYYEERAKGGTGLIITEITRVNDVTGASAFGQLAVSHDYHIKPLAEMAKRIHRHGAKIMVELHHPGRQNLSMLIGTVPLSIGCNKIMPFYSKMLYSLVPSFSKMMQKDLLPKVVSPSKCERSYFSNCLNKELSKSEIEKIIQQFVDGAVRVKKAGCDGVELHASHGYLIQQFLSPYTNRRTDEYGGNLENRMRFLLNIISGIRKECGNDFPIVVRLTVDEMYDRIGQPEKGYGLSEGIKMAQRLEKAGIDAIDVSSASYDTFNYWLEPTSFECGWRKNLAAEVKKAVSIPVLAANLIRSPEQAEAQLEDGIQDFISLGRPLIADPHWVEKVQSGRQNEVKRCICCLYCFESMQNGAYVNDHGHCSVNPFVGREKVELPKNGNGKKVVIIGAGPAGLMSAELLAKRGFAVTLLEKENTYGGQIQLANKPPKKDKLTWCVDDLYTNAIKAGAEIKLGIKATKEIIKEYDPAIVIVATGGNAVHPKAFTGDNVCTVTEILNGSIKLSGKKVAVIGSGMTGLETSELLCEQGNSVSIIEMADSIAPGAWFQNVDDALPKLKKAGTDFYTSSKLVSIGSDSITVESTKTAQKSEILCDFVVLSMGVRPDNALYEEIKDEFMQVYNIGDSNKIGRIANATESAYRLAKSIVGGIK